MIDNMKIENKYNGFGLVELIVSIGVAGIAIVVLMSMAANSMKEAVRLERQDALTRLAQDGALVVRKHAEDENHPETITEFSFINGNENTCYVINIEDSQVEFTEPSVVYRHSSAKIPEEPPNWQNPAKPWSPANLGQRKVHTELVQADYEDFHVDVIYDWDGIDSLVSDVYYLAYCIRGIEISTSLDLRTYVGSVVTGYVNCGGCSILPYEHSIIVNIRSD